MAHLCKRSINSNADEKAKKNNLLSELSDVGDELNRHIRQIQKAIDDIGSMSSVANIIRLNLADLLASVRDDFETTTSVRSVKITIDDALQNIEISADPNHLRLVFENLIKNSLRATSSVRAAMIGKSNDLFVEKISILLMNTIGQDTIQIRYEDNGRGMTREIAGKLYKEHVTTQSRGGHGLGGLMITKLLALNNGSVEVLRSVNILDDNSHGTLQKITLNRAVDLKDGN